MDFDGNAVTTEAEPAFGESYEPRTRSELPVHAEFVSALPTVRLKRVVHLPTQVPVLGNQGALHQTRWQRQLARQACVCARFQIRLGVVRRPQKCSKSFREIQADRMRAVMG